jgi:hypothetical protein
MVIFTCVDFHFLREGFSLSLGGLDCFAAVRAHGGAA